MTFTPKVWHDKPNTTTPVNAVSVTDIETRLAAYSDTITQAEAAARTTADAALSARIARTNFTNLTSVITVGGANPLGLRYRGMSMSSSPDPPTLVNSNYWGTGFSLAHVKSDVSNVIACGGNVVRGVGNGHEVLSGTITLSTYLANWKTFLDETRKAGVAVYATLVETNALGLGGATPSLTSIQPIMVALATLLDGYEHVIGIDLFNEINNGKQTSWVAPTVPLIRAVTTKPLTCDVHIGGLPFPTTGFIAEVAAWADFLDVHPYIGGPNGYTVTPAHYAALYTAFKLPILTGEIAGWETMTKVCGAIEAQIAICELPYVAGAIFWVLTNYSTDGSGPPAFTPEFTNAFVGNFGESSQNQQAPEVVRVFRALPTTTRPTATTTDVTAKAIVLGDTTDNYTAWYVEATATNVDPGDQVRLRVENEANAVIVDGTLTAEATVGASGSQSGTTITDASSHQRTVSIVGGVTAVAAAGPFGEDVMSFNGTGKLLISQFAFTTLYHFGMWIKPAADLTGIHHLAGQWKNGANPGSGDATVQVSYDADSECVGITSVRPIWPPRTSVTSNGTVPKGVWSYIECGREASGFLLAGADNASNIIHFEIDSVNFPNDPPLAGDGTTEFSVGGVSNGAGTFRGQISGLHVMGQALYTSGGSSDHPKPTAVFTSDSQTLLSLVANAAGSSGQGSGFVRVRTPILPRLPQALLATCEVANLTGSTITVDSAILTRLIT
jgi:hypothetical protein